MKKFLIFLVFCLAALSFAYAGKIYRYLQLKATSTREDTLFDTAPSGYFLARGDSYDKQALLKWKNEVELDLPSSRYALFSLAMYYFQAEKDYTKAIELFERVISEFPSTSIAASALLELGVCQMISGFGSAGLRSLEKFCDDYPDSWRVPAARMYIAIYYRENGNEQKAVELLERIARSYPSSPQRGKALSAAIDIYRKLNRQEDAARLQRQLDSAK